MEVFPAISIETRKISTMSFQYRRFIITGEEEEEEAKIENLLLISIDNLRIVVVFADKAPHKN